MDINQYRRKFRKEIDFFNPFIKYIRYISHPNMHEKKCNYGIENPDKIIYIIRNSNPKAGMFSLLNSILEKTMYAIEKGYYPIIDMQNYPNSYLKEKVKENAWEYFFEPLMGEKSISIASAYKSRHVILSTLAPTIEKYHFGPIISLQQESNEYKRIKAVYKRYFHIKNELIVKYETICKELIGNKKVVGVICRGTDYTSMKPYAHPIQPSLQDVMNKVDDFLEKYECTHIYLSTEDKEIVEKFLTKYGKSLLVYPRKYVKSKEKTYITDLINNSYEPKDAGIDYLGQIYALSKCQYGVLSLTSATPFICFQSNYKDCYIWNLGRYGFDD